MKIINLIALLFLSLGASYAGGQEVRPEDVGFRALSVASPNGTVRIFVSTEGHPVDVERILPLVLYIQGSGYSPIYYGSPDKLSNVLMLKPADFPGYHYAVVGKPGTPFWDLKKGKATRAYSESLTLGRRVADVSAAIDYLAAQRWVDSSRIVVIGHSEGAQVAPFVAAANGHVTHVAALAASGLSQAFDFVLDVRHRVREGALSFEEGQARITALYDQFRRILSSPSSTDSLWYGHTYGRWASFFQSQPLDAFLALNIPVFVAVGAYDKSSPVESADYIPIAFLLAGKDNLTYRVWPTDHGFQQKLPNGKRVDRRSDIVAALLEWLGNRSRASSAEHVDSPDGASRRR